MQSIWSVVLIISSALWFASLCYLLYGFAQILLSFSWWHFFVALLVFGLMTCLEIVVATMHG